MPISSGTRLGPYEIVAPIGAGGMGEVYRARDTRLDRSVAVKILPEAFAADARVRLRFEREAKTISQLSHPHICTLFDVGDNYIVMELLEGESLADRLTKGPLPLPEALKYGVQIAEALGKAHRGGVIHRDLKPGNDPGRGGLTDCWSERRREAFPRHHEGGGKRPSELQRAAELAAGDQ